MKKLLLLLFSLMLSFNSYGGSLDEKGLKCEHYHGSYGKPIYIWFDDGFFEIPIIEGTTIKWERYTYTEWGTKYIHFNEEERFFPIGYPFYYLKGARVNRENLILAPIMDSWKYTKYKCSVQSYKEWIVSDLQKKINDAQGKNQI